MKNKYPASVAYIPLIFIIILSLLPSNLLCSENNPSSKGGKGLKMVEAMNQIKNIVVWKDDKWVNLTNFSDTRHIYASETSHDQKYGFVSHEDYPPRELSIYDLHGMKLVKNLSLGFGAEVKWNHENNIVHVYGCGSGCMAARILNIDRLDQRWQAEAERETGAVEKTKCWDIKGCSPEQIKNCQAAKSSLPCWQAKRQPNGYLNESCLTCPVFVEAPIPALTIEPRSL